MADIIDESSALEEHLLNVALMNATAKSGKPSRMHCIDCEDEIPEVRRTLVAGCQRCVSCQSDYDLQKKLGVV